MLRIKLYLFLLLLLGVHTFSQAQDAAVIITVMPPTVTSGGSIQVTSPFCGEVRLESLTAGAVSCGELGVTYQWYEGSTLLSGTTLTGVSAGVHTYTRRTMAVGNPSSYLDVSFSVTVASCITVTPGSITAPAWAAAGTAFTIGSGTAATASSGGVTYSWTVNGAAVSGTGTTLSYTASTAGTYAFVRKATSVADNGNSATATVSVTVAPPWEQVDWSMSDDCTSCTWYEAIDKCNSLGKRLPNDSDWKALPGEPNVLGLTDSFDFWSATEYGSVTASYWYWHSGNGNLYGPSSSSKDFRSRARCVRN